MAKSKKEEVMFDFDETPKKSVSKKTEEPVKEEKKEVKPKTIKNVKESKFNDKDLIPCKSVTSGGLSFIGASGNKVRFEDYGMVEYVEYGDLRREAQSANPTNYLFYPRFIVLDSDFIEEFPKLEEFYNKFYTDEGDFEAILEMALIVLNKENFKKSFKQKWEKLLAEKIDPTALLVWFIENYPESKHILRKEYARMTAEFNISL